MLQSIPEQTPLLQRWVITSNPDNKDIWPKKTYSQFQRQLPTLLTQISKPIYRGTKFPWIEARRKALRTQADVDNYTQTFLKDFDSRTPFILPSITSFTTKKTLAKRFASEAKGTQLTSSIEIDEGYLHIVESGVKGVDIYKQIQNLELVELKGSDELEVAKDEKEVLLIPGTVLLPKARTARVFHWVAV